MKDNSFTPKGEKKKTRSKWYPAETITNIDYVDDLTFNANTLAQAKISAA